MSDKSQKVAGRLTIGKVAKLSGVGVETIRYYQREGIIVPPPKGQTSFREYPREVVNRIRFIKRAQELGFTLSEIIDLLGFWSAKQGSCERMRARAERKLDEVDAKIKDLARIRSALENVRSVCSRRRTPQECPVLKEFYYGQN
jgi:Hg(II)-responsive transcriptional regulator